MTRQGNNIEEGVDALRSNLRFYNGVQMKLMKRKFEAMSNSGETSALDKAIEWETYSPEFEEALKELVRESLVNDKDFVQLFSEHEEETILELEKRIQEYHLLELRLMKHINVHGKVPKNFIEWHSDFGSGLMKIMYSHPEIYKRYKESEDQTPEIQEEILQEIEGILYTEGVKMA